MTTHAARRARARRSELGARSVLNLELVSQETSTKVTQHPPAEPANQDFFIERAGVRRAGAHLIIDLYHADKLDELELIGQTLRKCRERGGVRCAGAHLIIDLYDADKLDELELIEQTLRKCVEVAGATLLHIHLHPFESSGGVSGVAVLAESHISIHTWPELRYAALDIFMCGQARPERCIEVLLEAFAPRRVAIEELLRGRV